MGTEMITLGGGCFWCTEAVFEQVEGVQDVESGYCNGHVIRPTYEQVCRGDTGHAEVVQLTFDPQRIPLRRLLEIFFALHDPTTRHRQGNDVGPQYRSGIYFHTIDQEAECREVLDAVDRVRKGRVVTEVWPRHNYWKAEDDHQHYFASHPQAGYCAWFVAPKVERLRLLFKPFARA